MIKTSIRDVSGKLQSKIIPLLPEGTIVSTPHTDVEYVVTEYGVVCLRWQSVAERTKRLIEIAHPDFRDQLKFMAGKYGWI